jgi:hypothetical protein
MGAQEDIPRQFTVPRIPLGVTPTLTIQMVALRPLTISEAPDIRILVMAKRLPPIALEKRDTPTLAMEQLLHPTKSEIPDTLI